jgi:hypothetical protein
MKESWMRRSSWRGVALEISYLEAAHLAAPAVRRRAELRARYGFG